MRFFQPLRVQTVNTNNNKTRRIHVYGLVSEHLEVDISLYLSTLIKNKLPELAAFTPDTMAHLRQDARFGDIEYKLGNLCKVMRRDRIKVVRDKAHGGAAGTVRLPEFALPPLVTLSYDQLLLSALFHQQIHHAYLTEACATPSALALLMPCTFNTLSLTSLAMVAVALSKTHTEDDLVDMRTYLRATISDQQLALIPLHGVTLVAAEVRGAGGAAGGGASAGSAAAAVGSITGTA